MRQKYAKKAIIAGFVKNPHVLIAMRCHPQHLSNNESGVEARVGAGISMKIIENLPELHDD